MIRSISWKTAVAAAATVATLAIVLAPPIDAQKQRRSEDSSASKKEKVSLSIVQVGDDVQILPGSDVAALRKELSDRHEADVKEWKKEKVAARKAKTPFTDEKPKAPAVKILKSGISSQEAAEKLLKDITDEMAAKARAALRFVVVNQEGTLSVMTSAQAEETKKLLVDQYKAALRDYAKNKKAAAKERSPFDVPKPSRPNFRIVSSRFKTENEATAALEKEQEKQSKRKGDESIERS